MTPHDKLPDIPAFLRIPQEVRRAAWKGVKVKPLARVKFAEPSKVEEPATRALRRQLARDEAKRNEAIREERRTRAAIAARKSK